VWDDKASQKGEDKVVKAHDHCLTGDTIVNTPDGDIAIEDLVGKSGSVYCVDNDGKPTVGKFSNVRKTRKDAAIYELELEDGSKIRATGDHLILTENGWKELINLTPEDIVVRVR
jgi:intein/homing endonuclease